MKTKHRFFFANSGNMKGIKNDSVDLIVTSPAYPMIEMWDDLYGKQNPEIKHALENKQGEKACRLMHQELNKTWKECYRVLKKGGMACINIGDATRTIGGRFQLYSNHSRLIFQFKELGFDTLPIILWHKKTNAPNKFMGSGMLPAGAYVTLEHEYILIFRKGPKRIFKPAGPHPQRGLKPAQIGSSIVTSNQSDIKLRRRSAFFWEERNKWFSDIWFDLPGVSQNLNNNSLRKRSAAFPLELAYRLICMYSVQSDTVLDPFAGSGTTALACLATGRNSVSFETDKSFRSYIIDRLTNSKDFLNNITTQRLLEHIRCVGDYVSYAEKTKEKSSPLVMKNSKMKYKNHYYGFPVMTKQETELQFPFLKSVSLPNKNVISAEHSFIADKPLSTAGTKVFNAKKIKSTNYKQITMEI